MRRGSMPASPARFSRFFSPCPPSSHSRQDPQPAVEQLPLDLVMPVERGEHEAVLRQPERGARDRRIRYRLAVVGRLVGRRQPRDLLAEEAHFRLGQDDLVGDDVVHEPRAHAARVAEVVHLHRRRAQREDLRAALGGVALAVDQHVDAVGRDAPRGLLVRAARDVDEAVEPGDEAPAILAAVVDAEGVAVHLESPAVVRLQQPGGQVPRGVVVEVARDVADAQPVARAARRLPGLLQRGDPFPDALRVARGDRAAQLGRKRHQQRGEGRDAQHERIARVRAPAAREVIDLGRGAVPFTGIQQRLEQVGVRLGVLRVEAQDFAVMRNALRQLVADDVGVGEVQVRGGIGGVELDRARQMTQRFLEAVLLPHDQAQVGMVLRRRRRARQQLAEQPLGARQVALLPQLRGLLGEPRRAARSGE
jgi:hypothetical protein